LNTLLHVVTLAAALAGAGDGRSQTANGSDGYVRIPHALVSLIDQVDVPAQASGVLTAVEARPGMEVEPGMRLVQIDDSLARAKKLSAERERDKAKQLAENDVKVRYAKAAAKVLETEYSLMLEANRKAPNSYSSGELRRVQLNVQRATLEIEQAELEQRMAAYTRDVRQAELEAAELEIQRRCILSPLAGMIVDVKKKVGEWVEEGETVFTAVRLDQLEVEGFVNAREFGAGEVSGRPIHVLAELERGRLERFTGRVTFVDPNVQADGAYRVTARIDNRMENNEWLLRPGMTVEVAIELAPAPLAKQPAGEVKRR